MMKGIFLVHGDPDQAEKLRNGIQAIGFPSIGIPERGEQAVLQ